MSLEKPVRRKMRARYSLALYLIRFELCARTARRQKGPLLDDESRENWPFFHLLLLEETLREIGFAREYAGGRTRPNASVVLRSRSVDRWRRSNLSVPSADGTRAKTALM